MRADEDTFKRIRMEKYSKVLSVSPLEFRIISSYTIKVIVSSLSYKFWD